MSIRILICDDHKIFIEGLTALLLVRSDLKVVGAAFDGHAALSLAQELRPDVILLDLAMPSLNGIDIAREILKKLPATHIIVLSARSDSKSVRDALAAGAKGYVDKVAAVEELGRAIAAVMQGQTFLSAAISQQMAGDVHDSDRSNGNGNGHPLSARERRVLQLLAEGKATKEAAAAMGVSVKTVETHRRAIMEKLKLYSVAELTKHAIREGLTSVDS